MLFCTSLSDFCLQMYGVCIPVGKTASCFLFSIGEPDALVRKYWYWKDIALAVSFFFVYVVSEHSKGAYPCQSSLSAGRKVVNPKHCKLHLEHFSQRPGLVFPTSGTRMPNAWDSCSQRSGTLFPTGREQSVQPIGLKRFHVSSV